MSFLQEAFSEFNSAKGSIAATCKYVGDSDEVINGLFRDKLIRFSQPWALNDPVEVNPALKLTFGDESTTFTHFILKGIRLPSYREHVYLNFIEARYNRYGILSLSKELFSYDMWNRYANAHKGFIIDFSQQLDEKACFHSSGLFSGMVNYLDKFEIEIDRPVGVEGYATYDYLNEKLFLNKTNHWKAEREYRIIRPLSEHPEFVQPTDHKSYRDDKVYLFPYDPNAITTIVFGAAMSPNKKRKIMELTSGMKIAYFQALIDRETFDMYYLQVSLWKSQEHFLAQMPQVFVTDDWEFKYKDLEKTVGSFEELPYSDDPVMLNSVADFYKRKNSKRNKGL